MEIPKADDMLMTTREVAHLLHVHPNTVRKWVTEGLLTAYRLGPRGDRRFTREEIQRFLHTTHGTNGDRPHQ